MQGELEGKGALRGPRGMEAQDLGPGPHSPGHGLGPRQGLLCSRSPGQGAVSTLHSTLSVVFRVLVHSCHRL